MLKRRSVWPWVAVFLFAGLIFTAWGLERTVSKAARDRYKTLTAAAETALAKSDFDAAGRFAIIAIKGHDKPLIGFDDRQAEEVLALAVSYATRENLGKPERELQLPTFKTKHTYIDSPPQTVWVSATNNRAILLSGDDDHKIYSQWDIKTGAVVGQPFDFPKGTFMVNTSDDNRYAILLGKAVSLYDLEKRIVLPQSIPAMETFSSAPIYSSANKVMITEADDGPGFVVWNFSQEKPTPQQVNIDLLNFHLAADGRRLIISRTGGRLAVWDIATRSFLPEKSLEAFKSRSLAAFGGKAFFDMESPWNDETSLSAAEISRLPDAPFVLTNPPFRFESFLDYNDRPFYSDGTSISVIRFDHVLRTYRLRASLLLRGPKLIELACTQAKMRHLKPEDVITVPILNLKRDGKICA